MTSRILASLCCMSTSFLFRKLQLLVKLCPVISICGMDEIVGMLYEHRFLQSSRSSLFRHVKTSTVTNAGVRYSKTYHIGSYFLLRLLSVKGPSRSIRMIRKDIFCRHPSTNGSETYRVSAGGHNFSVSIVLQVSSVTLRYLNFVDSFRPGGQLFCCSISSLPKDSICEAV